MPDLNDLHDAFARLEQQVPENYRSQLVAERVSEVLGQTDPQGRKPRRWAVGATALLAAAAVAAIAVASVTLTHHGRGNAPTGNQPTSGQSTRPSPSKSPETPTSTQTPTPGPTPYAGAMPVSRSALVAYVRAARSVVVNTYQQAEPGPGQAMQPTPGIAEFNTPSGNITCAIVDGTRSGSGANVVCQAQQFSFRIPPKPASCQNNWVAYFGFVTGGQVRVGACVGGPEFGPTTMTLPYGSAIELSGIGCRSESGFLACADLATGHGFAVNRDAIKKY